MITPKSKKIFKFDGTGNFSHRGVDVDFEQYKAIMDKKNEQKIMVEF